MEVASELGTHLKATTALHAPLQQASSVVKMPGWPIGPSTVADMSPGCNWACLSTQEGTDYWAHPGLGDSVIHLGAIPAAGQP